MFKLEKIAQLASTLLFANPTLAVREKIRDVTTHDDIELLMAPYDFSVFSFFKPSDPDSVEIDDIVRLAKNDIDSKIKEGKF